MYNEIYNPENRQKVSVQSKEGQEIIRNYLSYLQGGAKLQQLNKQLRKCQQQMENIQREISQVQSRQRGGGIFEGITDAVKSAATVATNTVGSVASVATDTVGSVATVATDTVGSAASVATDTVEEGEE